MAFDKMLCFTQVKAVYVKNLPKNVTQGQLKKLFEHHGKIIKVALPPAKSGQEKNRIGFVHFSERSSAMKALKNTERYELEGDYFFGSSLYNVSLSLSNCSVICNFPVFRSSSGVFSCKAAGRSKVIWIKYSEVRVASCLPTSCWLWFNGGSLWCSWCRLWPCWFCAGQIYRKVLM